MTARGTTTQETLSIEDLLDHHDWLRQLARSLVHDPSSVDDVVQETWLAALRRPPARQSHPRGWLAIVLRRTASRVSRDRCARRRREQASATAERSPSTSELVETARTQRELVSALLELDDPFRETLLLRHFEGMAPREIARHLDVPVDTVHTWLQRGHARLRTRLGDRFGDDWRQALLPLAGSSTAISGTVAGAALAFLLAGIGASAFHVLRPPPREGHRPVASVDDRADVSPGSPSHAIPSTPGPSDRQVAARPTEAPPTDDSRTAAHDQPIFATVVDIELRPQGGVRLRRAGPLEVRWQGGDPIWIANAVDTARVSLEDQARLREDRAFAERFCVDRQPEREWRAVVLGEAIPDREQTSDAAGRFALASDDDLATIDLADRAWTVFAGGTTAADDAVLIVTPAVDVEGRVIESSGDPLARARVALDEESLRDVESRLPGIDVTRRPRPPVIFSDSDGRFVLRRAPAVAGIRLRVSKGGFTAATLDVPGSTRRDLAITLRRGTERPAFAGVVLDGEARPLAGAQVHLGACSGATGGDGRFLLDASEVTASSTLVVVAEGRQAIVEEGYGARVRADPWDHVDVTLTLEHASSRIAGRIVWEDGSPVHDVHVNLADPTLFDSTFSTVESRAGGYARSVTVDSGGFFTIAGLSARAYRLRIYDATHGLFVISDPIEAGTSSARVVVGRDLHHEPLRGRVVDADGRPVVGLRVAVSFPIFRGRSGGALNESTRPVDTDAIGAFELQRVPRAHATIVIGAADRPPSAYPVDELDSDGEVVLVYPRPTSG